MLVRTVALVALLVALVTVHGRGEATCHPSTSWAFPTATGVRPVTAPRVGSDAGVTAPGGVWAWAGVEPAFSGAVSPVNPLEPAAPGQPLYEYSAASLTWQPPLLDQSTGDVRLQVPPPSIPVPDLPNPLDAFDRLSPDRLAGDLLEALLSTLGEALLGALRAFIDWALGLDDSSLNFVTRTPAAGTTDSPTVRSLWDFSRAVANAGLALVLMWGGFGVMLKQQTHTPYHDLMELLPRVILGALAANLTLLFATVLIDLNNAFAAGVGQTDLPGYDQATPTQTGMAAVLVAAVYGIVAVLLVLQMLMRLALIDLLIILSPVMVLCWVLPQTQGWFRWWTGLFPTTVFQQVIQLVTLRLGAALMVELTPGSAENALLTLFLGIAVCWLTLKVPALLRGGAHRAGLTAVVSTVLVSRAAGGLLAAGGTISGAAGGSSAGGAAANRPLAGRTNP